MGEKGRDLINKLKFLFLGIARWLKKCIMAIGNIIIEKTIINTCEQYVRFWKDLIITYRDSGNVERFHMLSSGTTLLLGYGSFFIFAIYGMSFNYPFSIMYYYISVLLFTLFLMTVLIVLWQLIIINIPTHKKLLIFVLLLIFVFSLFVFFMKNLEMNLPKKIGEIIVDRMENEF